MIAVEEVRGRVASRRFVELPFAFHREEPRWAPSLASFERWRLDRYSHPYYRDARWQRFLVRSRGRIVGRIMAHVGDGDPERGRFGFFDVADDEAAAAALVEAAAAWCRDEECTTMSGPVSPTETDEAGVLVEGFDTPGLTGRPWHPEWYAAHLVRAGLAPLAGSDRATERRAPGGSLPFETGGEHPRHAGRWVDPRLVGAEVAAVPDLAPALRVSPMALARQARRGFDTCCVVRVGDDGSAAVDALLAQAGRAGYEWVVVPTSPSPAAETVHRQFTLTL